MRYQQTEIAECGLICLAYSSAKLGAHLELSELRRRFPISSRGLNLRQISEIATALDLMARSVRCDIGELGQLKLPAILHWGLNHFVVLERVSSKDITIHDPASGRRKVQLEQAGRRFTGVAVELSRSAEFKRRPQKSQLSIWSWIDRSKELYSGIGQVFVLSILLQVYVVGSPFFIQLAIDQAAFKGDRHLLTTLAVGFGAFGLFNIAASTLRSLAMQQLSAFVSWDMSLRLFRHLVRLPLPWFQRRRLADTISRFDSITPIRDLISGSLVTSVIDGALALTTLCMMVIFSWPLACVAFIGTLAYGATRALTLPESLRLSSETLGAQIAENVKRIETIKAIQTIKQMAAETEQETQWGNRYADYIKRTVAKSRFQISTTAANQTIDLITYLAIVYFSAADIMDNKMSVGVFYAFLAYRSQFGSSIVNVIEQIIQWKLSDIYSFRLADIVLTPKEEGIDRVESLELEMDGQIDIERVSFRYSGQESWVLRNLNLSIKSGEFVAIIGPSGVGKSSLLKVLCGLYTPLVGEVKIDGRTLSAWGPKAVRHHIGIVMQDDELLSGSIAENVAFFDADIDMGRVWQALGDAAIKDEILAMPMKAESLVGDMGGALSGGQKQRLLIARALYKKPRILLLDEATSHLDPQNEIVISENIKRLNITRVVIAHRRETIMAADRIFDLRTSSFVSLPANELGATKQPGPNLANNS